MKLKDEWLLGQIMCLGWALWERRNKLVFEHRIYTVDQTLQRALSCCMVPPQPSSAAVAAWLDGEVTGAATHSVTRAHGALAQAGPGPGRWQPPPPRFFKLNVDVAAAAERTMGCGFVVRNTTGQLLASGCSKHRGSLSVALGEALSLRWALQLALDLGFLHVLVETDSLIVVNTWRNIRRNNSYLASIVRDCISISSSFIAFEIVHARRTANMAADFMAKYALAYPCNVWIEDGPPGLEAILAFDVATLHD
ncbi:uncharacterized protein LOC130719967 [Lotus japonicus]|uniref:uncharacterized protein LOC130719967 n=1 Tax=Lotus japonicus TaxID=34305 RepID=UPI002584403D|nr:uncharacterized protein LOC130719967 [Lotus japonicus]